MNKFRSLLLLLLLSTAVVLAGFIYKNYDKLPGSVSVNLSGDGLDIGLENFHLVEEVEGQKKWEIKAHKAAMMDSMNATRLKGLRMTFFQPEDKVVVLKADRGIVNNKTRDMEAHGNVVIYNDRYRLESKKLFCESATQKVTTDKFVKITGRNFKLTGDGMVSDLKRETMEVLSNVRMTLYPDRHE